MTFRAVHEQWGAVFAHLPDLGCGRAWKDVHRVRPLAPLSCDECRHPMHAKVSPTGLRFFAHTPGAPDCAAAGESLAHHLLKLELSTATRAAGADAEMEVRGPEGAWRADVMASDPAGAWRIALEAQLSPITSDDLKARTARMRADGVRSVWFSDRAAPPWLGAAPSVRLEHRQEDGGSLVVAEGLVRFQGDVWTPAPPVPLAEFLRWVFTGLVVPHTRRAPSAYDMRPLEFAWTAPRYVQQETEHLEAEEAARQRRIAFVQEQRDAAQRRADARRRAEAREAAQRTERLRKEAALRESAEARARARQAQEHRRVRWVMAGQERDARAASRRPPRLGERQHVADHAIAVLARDRGIVAEVGWSLGHERYAGGLPLVGDGGRPVAVVDPDPEQVDVRASRLLAAVRLMFTSDELRTRFLTEAPAPPDGAGDGYWTITLDVPPAPPARRRRKAPDVPVQPAPAAPVIPPAPVPYVPPQTAAATRTPPPPPPACGCPEPRLVVEMPTGPVAARPCERMTASAALFAASCEECGGTYAGPWQRA